MESPWLVPGEAAAYSKKSKDTILAALRAGELRGSQIKPRSPWLVHRDDLDAWLRGEPPVAKPAIVTRRRAS